MSLELKDIHLVFKNLRIEGRRTEELEALLVHSDDLYELLASLSEFKTGLAMQAVCQKHVDNSIFKTINLYVSGETTIYGIKIIGSPYVQPGSIFKIFKNDKPYVYPSYLQTTTEPLSLDEKKRLSLDEKKRLIKLMVDGSKMKKTQNHGLKEKKYSQTRKIELG